MYKITLVYEGELSEGTALPLAWDFNVFALVFCFLCVFKRQHSQES